MAGQLLVSVSGICDRTLDEIAVFTEEMDRRSIPLSFLVSPRLKGKYRLVEDQPTVDWLAARRSRGDAIVLHGYDQAATKKRRDEFAALPAHEANLRLMAADRVMEQTGLRTRLFAAPGWTASAGAIEMLPRNGFRLNIGLSRLPIWCVAPRCAPGYWVSERASSPSRGGAACWCCRRRARPAATVWYESPSRPSIYVSRGRARR